MVTDVGKVLPVLCPVPVDTLLPVVTTGVLVVLLPDREDTGCPVVVCGCDTGLAASGEAVVSWVMIEETGDIIVPVCVCKVAASEVN